MSGNGYNLINPVAEVKKEYEGKVDMKKMIPTWPKLTKSEPGKGVLPDKLTPEFSQIGGKSALDIVNEFLARVQVLFIQGRGMTKKQSNQLRIDFIKEIEGFTKRRIKTPR